jgi:hypothetical protein
MYVDVGEVGADLVFVVAEVLGHLLDRCGLDHGLGQCHEQAVFPGQRDTT